VASCDSKFDEGILKTSDETKFGQELLSCVNFHRDRAGATYKSHEGNVGCFEVFFNKYLS
jgi:hypothetical protein